jgi:hypothetical protein
MNSKLEQTLKERDEARVRVLELRKAHRDAVARRDAAAREVEETDAKIMAAQRRFVEKNDAIKPLLDADLAGVLGGKRLEQLDEQPAAAVESA